MTPVAHRLPLLARPLHFGSSALVPACASRSVRSPITTASLTRLDGTGYLASGWYNGGMSTQNPITPEDNASLDFFCRSCGWAGQGRKAINQPDGLVRC